MTTTENEDHQRWIGAVEGYRLVASDDERRDVCTALWALGNVEGLRGSPQGRGAAFRRAADLLSALYVRTELAEPLEETEDWTPPRQSPAEQAQPWCDLTAGERTTLATWLRVRAPEPLNDHDRRIVAAAEQALAALPALLDNERQRDILEQRLAWVTGKLAEMCGGDVEEGDIALVTKMWARNAQMLRNWGPVHRYLQRVKPTEQLGPISIIRGLSDGIAASARECDNDAAEQAASLGATATLLQELKDAATAQPEAKPDVPRAAADSLAKLQLFAREHAEGHVDAIGLISDFEKDRGADDLIPQLLRAIVEVHAPKSSRANPTPEPSPSLAAAKAWARLSRGQQVLRWLRAPFTQDVPSGCDRTIAADALKTISHLLDLIDDKGPADSCHKCSDVIGNLHSMLHDANLEALQMRRVCAAFDETDIDLAATDAENAARLLRELREYLSIGVRGPRWILDRIKQTHPMGKLAADYLEKLSGLELAGLTSALAGLGGDAHSPAALTAELIRALKQAQVDAEAAG